MWGYNLIETITLISGAIGISTVVVHLYDLKVQTERENELLKLRLEIEEVYKGNTHTLELNTQAITTLAKSIDKLNSAVDLMQDKIVDLATEQSATKESVKSAPHSLDVAHTISRSSFCMILTSHPALVK